MESKDTKEQIEKDLLKGIEETGITYLSRELLDDKRTCYLVLTSQLLGLRQGYKCAIKEVKDMIDIMNADYDCSDLIALKEKLGEKNND